MISQSGSDPVTFSAQTNPFLRQAEGDTFNIFGKKVKKKDLTKLLGDFSKIGSEDDDDDENGAPKIIGPRAKGTLGSAPKYRPIDLYGGFLSMYGGQKVRGGLLGE